MRWVVVAVLAGSISIAGCGGGDEADGGADSGVINPDAAARADARPGDTGTADSGVQADATPGMDVAPGTDAAADFIDFVLDLIDHDTNATALPRTVPTATVVPDSVDTTRFQRLFP